MLNGPPKSPGRQGGKRIHDIRRRHYADIFLAFEPLRHVFQARYHPLQWKQASTDRTWNVVVQAP